jgi:hypothetical protein
MEVLDGLEVIEYNYKYNNNKMASVIKTRTISSVADNRIQMSNSYFTRGFTPPSGWSTLRLAFRFSFTDLGGTAGSTPSFVFGLCSGQTNIYGDATTTHFVGWKTTPGSWDRDTNWSIYTNSGSLTFQPFKRITSTDTNGSGTQVAYGLPYNVAAIRNVIYADIIKGSPNYTLRLYGPNIYSAGIGDVAVATFNTQALNSSPSVSNHGAFTDRTLAVDEVTNGVLDHINFSWNRTDFLLEISDIQIIRIA